MVCMRHAALQPTTYIGNFKSEVEAQDWIIRKAKDHFANGAEQ
jgi:hypothetical protein